MRTKKALINIIGNICVQISSIIIGLIIPKLIISSYGSSVNGLIQMVTQIVSYFGIIEGGVATAAGAAIYKPLAMHDEKKVNKIMTAVKDFYLKTGIFFTIIGIILCIGYPITVKEEISMVTASCIIFLSTIISISGYLVFNKYNMILVADQNHYIVLMSGALTNILIALFQIVLIKLNANILWVVSLTPAINLIRLLLIRRYVKKKYKYLTYDDKEPDKAAISKKWEALSLNVSQMCKIVIPLITLSFMFDLKVVSVYSIYSMVFRVGSSLIETIGNSLTASMGNLIATEDNKNVLRIYDMAETLIHLFISVVSIGFFILIIPFIKIYIGINADANYIAPLLAISFIINELVINVRFAPKLILKAKGILKEVSRIAILEITLCAILTPIFCKLFGYQAVLFGSITTGLIQTIFMIIKVNVLILKTKIWNLLKKIFVNILSLITSYIIINNFIDINPKGYISFGIDMIIVAIVTTIILLLFNYLFLRKNLMSIINQFKNVLKLKKRGQI